MIEHFDYSKYKKIAQFTSGFSASKTMETGKQ